MRFSIALVASILITLVLSLPLPDNKDSNDKDSDKNGKNSSRTSSASASASASGKSDKKASDTGATLSKGGASVLTSQSASDLQISDGVAGNAKAEAVAKFQGLDKGDLAKVSDTDLKLIKGIHDTAEKVEKEAFNPAIAAASGDEAKALKNGKIKNKVLKTSAAVLALEIQAAKGQKVDSNELAKEKAKQAKNIKLDADAKGQDSKSVI